MVHSIKIPLFYTKYLEDFGVYFLKKILLKYSNPSELIFIFFPCGLICHNASCHMLNVKTCESMVDFCSFLNRKKKKNHC